jgi:hypothetical protein
MIAPKKKGTYVPILQQTFQTTASFEPSHFCFQKLLQRMEKEPRQGKDSSPKREKNNSIEIKLSDGLTGQTLGSND